mmetsp:Transcript_46763/g.125005  ORF Transcript_46763/g.125005 Transcript_46763/m.125005 type:complete len:91 (+) Transcript_46763:123-395(+)
MVGACVGCIVGAAVVVVVVVSVGGIVGGIVGVAVAVVVGASVGVACKQIFHPALVSELSDVQVMGTPVLGYLPAGPLLPEKASPLTKSMS